MRNTAFKVSLLSCALLFVSAGQTQAITMNNLALTDKPFNSKLANDAQAAETKKEIKPKEEKKPVEKPVELPIEKPTTQHTVAEGESLTSIADNYQTTWIRLYAKNTQIVQPDLISVTDVVTIPESSEQLVERALPEVIPEVATTSVAIGNSNRTQQPIQVARTNSPGNTYAPGYCTWYAKNRRPDLPNRLGNASAWVASAAAQGFATGSAPQAGAIGQQGNHIVYVESVNGDGTVTVSEMNYSGLYVISNRTVSARNFRYIY